MIDFLGCGLDINYPGYRLVSWKQLCKARDQVGCGTLDLEDFNNALLGKCWWKLATGVN